MEPTIENIRGTIPFLILPVTLTLTLTACLLVSEVVLALPLPQTIEPQPVSTKAASASVPVPQNVPEMTSREGTTSFKVNVRLVQVRVVVRDSHGKAIGNLSKEDFQLLDDGKPQIITRFDVEKDGQPLAREQTTSSPAESPQGPSTPPIDVAERYIAYVFDDVHITFQDLAQVRQAAQKNLARLEARDRAAIFTTSGQGDLDFTDDRNKLNDALLHLLPHPMGARSADPNPCPKMTYYIADQIVNLDSPQALGVMTNDVLHCQFDNDSRLAQAAEGVARGAAADALAIGNLETRAALSSIKAIVRRVSLMPGRRSVVLVSPGFLTTQFHSEVDEIIENAVRADLTISALDSRGLYVLMLSGEAADSNPVSPEVAMLEHQYQSDSASADADVIAEFADGTGGTFFHNSNDLAEGLRRGASVPEYSYVLAFSPQNLKLNGQFHKLKVKLNTKDKFSIQARQGYFAPKHAADPGQEAKHEIEEALFSREEMRDLPVDLHTQFFKPSYMTAKLTVVAHIDVRPLHFQKADGRNNDSLTIVSGVFDRNGVYVTGSEKILEMHLKDETLGSKLNTGLDVRTSFDVKPGGYMVRVVVRDEEGDIAGVNGTVQIP
jgi:VWFA-related protein